MRTRSLFFSAATLLAAGCVLTGDAVAQDRNAPGPPHTSNLVVGEAAPTEFVLESIDNVVYDLGAIDRPTLLLFFRGTW